MATVTQIIPVTISTAAAGIVRDLLQQRNLDNTYGLRVFISGRTCSGFQYGMGFENKPSETDTVFKSEGLDVIVDEGSLQFMAGARIDYIDDEHGKGFLVDNPNMAPSCSCESGSCGTDDH